MLIGLIGLIGLIKSIVGLVFLALLIVLVLSFITGTKMGDWLSPARWKSVLTYLLKYLLEKLGDKPGTLQPHEIEQYMFRILACSKCIPSKCVSGCGCYGVARMNVRNDYCSLGRWGEFKSKEDWEDYKKQYNVKFSLELNSVNIDNIETDGYNTTGDV